MKWGKLNSVEGKVVDPAPRVASFQAREVVQGDGSLAIALAALAAPAEPVEGAKPITRGMIAIAFGAAAIAQLKSLETAEDIIALAGQSDSLQVEVLPVPDPSKPLEDLALIPQDLPADTPYYAVAAYDDGPEDGEGTDTGSGEGEGNTGEGTGTEGEGNTGEGTGTTDPPTGETGTDGAPTGEGEGNTGGGDTGSGTSGD